MKKRTYIVSTYNNYEWITTVDSYYKLFLMIMYAMKGYKTWNYPMWLIRLTIKYLNINIYRDVTATFELYVKGSDQVTHWTPYDNFR